MLWPKSSQVNRWTMDLNRTEDWQCVQVGASRSSQPVLQALVAPQMLHLKTNIFPSLEPVFNS
jgi:hypothetical protein